MQDSDNSIIYFLNMQAAVFLNNHFFNEQMKNKMAKAENLNFQNETTVKISYIYRDMTGVSLYCNNYSLLYIIGQKQPCLKALDQTVSPNPSKT